MQCCFIKYIRERDWWVMMPWTAISLVRQICYTHLNNCHCFATFLIAMGIQVIVSTQMTVSLKWNCNNKHENQKRNSFVFTYRFHDRGILINSITWYDYENWTAVEMHFFLKTIIVLSSIQRRGSERWHFQVNSWMRETLIRTCRLTALLIEFQPNNTIIHFWKWCQIITRFVGTVYTVIHKTVC